MGEEEATMETVADAWMVQARMAKRKEKVARLGQEWGLRKLRDRATGRIGVAVGWLLEGVWRLGREWELWRGEWTEGLGGRISRYCW